MTTKTRSVLKETIRDRDHLPAQFDSQRTADELVMRSRCLLPGFSTMEYARASVAADSLAVLRAAGRGCVRRRLEALVNAGVLGVAGAQQVYRDAFGGELKAVKDTKPSKLFGWLKGREFDGGRERPDNRTSPRRVTMRIATIALASLFLACAGNGSGIALTTTPDAAWGEEVAAVSPPDTRPAVDTLVVTGPEAQTDTRPATDVGVATGSEVSLDTLPPVQPDVQIAVDVLSAQPDTMRVPGPEAGREAGPEVANMASFPRCTYGAQPVLIAKAGVYCGRYPELGPNGTIACYTGCKMEKVDGVLTAATNLDSTSAGYCTTSIDDFATSGSANTRNGLCFDAAATCATVCPSQ
jgi:hypothetical protein